MWLELLAERQHAIACRDLGTGSEPLLHLHGGWGHDIYPFDQPLSILARRYRVLIPDRAGYGRSGRRHHPFPLEFHRQAAAETLRVMDALEIESAVLWGHSDGACTAVWMGLEAPQRCRAIILEALHFDRAKPSSRRFFTAMATEPRAFGPRVAAVLAAEHGVDYWEQLLRIEGRVWGALRETPHSHTDLFDGRLGELDAPVLILHGAEDPRTEPGELAAVQAALPHAETRVIAGAGHSPHSETETWPEVAAAITEFLGLDRA